MIDDISRISAEHFENWFKLPSMCITNFEFKLKYFMPSLTINSFYSMLMVLNQHIMFGLKLVREEIVETKSPFSFRLNEKRNAAPNDT